MISIFFIINILISVMHPLKYIPQITHINRRQSVEDISLNYVLCEIMENLISTSLTFKMILDTHEFVYFIPIFSEKIITFTSSFSKTCLISVPPGPSASSSG